LFSYFLISSGSPTSLPLIVLPPLSTLNLPFSTVTNHVQDFGLIFP
jgi:hypothetical protein